MRSVIYCNHSKGDAKSDNLTLLHPTQSCPTLIHSSSPLSWASHQTRLPSSSYSHRVVDLTSEVTWDDDRKRAPTLYIDFSVVQALS